MSGRSLPTVLGDRPQAWTMQPGWNQEYVYHYEDGRMEMVESTPAFLYYRCPIRRITRTKLAEPTPEDEGGS